ncbi:sporulation inhibitor of replication protein SirA [Aureibacillus halotolerans]|uniref:Uncharacterized protein DUF2522 n=1 Tax=Aureibacillus halotolerans TaxID=1508390 RepID=A0A4R6U2Z0_9BACI|nr:sporulation inhibitor of replication protein SirA [Aureibacillus halotolerans]TDQ39742.1 uncharacterized protein DUF2522 [Aureibacillus halotolerans]
MSVYEIYLVKESVAYDFFGKEHKLFNLFLENQYEDSTLAAILQKQVTYITCSLSEQLLITYILSRTSGARQHTSEPNVITYYDTASKGATRLTVCPDRVLLESEGCFSGEMSFFESLRSFHGYFFASDYESSRFGWLKPLRLKNTLHPTEPVATSQLI